MRIVGNMERATIQECLEKRVHIVYNSQGDKKVVFDGGNTKALPLELENVQVSALTETLNYLLNKLYRPRDETLHSGEEDDSAIHQAVKQ